jgi:hypothetical protein
MRQSSRVTIAGEKFDKRDLAVGGEYVEILAEADQINEDALESLSAEDEAEREKRIAAFRRMGHSPVAEEMKEVLNAQFRERAGRYRPGSVDRYPFLPRTEYLGRHGFLNYIPTEDIAPGTTQTINSILRDVPDDHTIMACGHSEGWSTMPASDFRTAVKRNQVRLTGQVLRGGADAAIRTGDGVYCIYFGAAKGLAFRILEG